MTRYALTVNDGLRTMEIDRFDFASIAECYRAKWSCYFPGWIFEVKAVSE